MMNIGYTCAYFNRWSSASSSYIGSNGKLVYAGSLYIDKLIPTWHYKQKLVLNELINGVDNLKGLSRWNPSIFFWSAMVRKQTHNNRNNLSRWLLSIQQMMMMKKMMVMMVVVVVVVMMMVSLNVTSIIPNLLESFHGNDSEWLLFCLWQIRASRVPNRLE